MLFLEASDAALIRRYEANRRSHPLQGGGRLADGVAAERAVLEPLRQEADVVVDTSELSVHQLRAEVERAFAHTAPERKASLTVVSFGFKYGLPLDADLVIDMRFLPNPYWIPELRDHTGREQDVSDYVLSQEGATEFLDRYVELIDLISGGYKREGKRYLTLAVGCTGGKHRSVAVAEELRRRLRGRCAGRPGRPPRPGQGVVSRRRRTGGRRRPKVVALGGGHGLHVMLTRAGPARRRHHRRRHRRRRRRLVRPAAAGGARHRAAGRPADGADRAGRAGPRPGGCGARPSSTGSAARARWPGTRSATSCWSG